TLINPVPTAWFQSINALAIFVLAPVFAYLWTKWNPSIPSKMAAGVLLMGSAFALMIGAARQEDRPSRAAKPVDRLPAGVEEVDGKLRPTPEEGKEPEHFYHAGRLTLDPETKVLHLRGVLADTERDRIVRDTAPKDFRQLVAILQAVTAKAKGE